MTTPAHELAQEARRCIIDDVHGTPVAKRASLNLAAAVVLLLAAWSQQPRRKRSSVRTSRRSSIWLPSSRWKVRHLSAVRHRPRTRNARFTVGPNTRQGSRITRRACAHPPHTRPTLTTWPGEHPRRVGGRRPEAGRTANASREGSTAKGVGAATTKMRTGAGARHLTPKVRGPTTLVFLQQLPQLSIAP
jgi:hypothetical protein